MLRMTAEIMLCLSKVKEVFSFESRLNTLHGAKSPREDFKNDLERGDVPGWVLVVLMTTGLVTAIWTIAAPRLSTIVRNSLDSMNGIR